MEKTAPKRFNALMIENITLKGNNARLEKLVTKLRDDIADLKFQLSIKDEKIQKRNHEIALLMHQELIDLTNSPPPAPTKKRKRSIDQLIDTFMASFQDSPYWGDEETKDEEVVYIDPPKPKRKLKY